jgi:glucose/arabinose dehydrogenase
MKQKSNTSAVAGNGLLAGVFFILLAVLMLASGCKKDDNDDGVPDKMDLQIFADNLVSPIGVVSVPDDTKRMFIIDQAGQIWIVDANGTKLPTPFMDLTSRMAPLNPGFDERGLLGLAFHPNYKNNGKFYVYYNAPPRAGGPTPTTSWNNLSRISEFLVTAGNANLGNIGSERPLIEIDDPQLNHNGGTLAFGPDGYLYISIGDGGGANDTAAGHVNDWYGANAGGNGQDIENNLFGNILRIDVNSGSPYAIPPDNPFVGKTGLDEIYAYGFRNPYRMSFDMSGNRALYVGDAGQKLYEEVSIVTKGGNYGWNVKEGTHCFDAATTGTMGSCPATDIFSTALVDPVIEMNNLANPAGGIGTLTVIGGNVYRGAGIKGLGGKYVFGSYSKSGSSPQGELFMSQPKTGSGLWSFEEMILTSYPDHLGMFVKGFGQDNDGEIYITTSTIGGPTGNTGKVFKLVRSN